jgi:hypothetical protein
MNPLAVGVLAVAALCALGIWRFSQAFGLDMSTGFSVVVRLLAVAVAAGLALYASSSYSFDMFRLGNTWPILLAMLWVAWWPALDYWAAQEVPTFLRDTTSVWWDAWYTKAGGIICIVGLGYLIKKMLDD